MSSLSSSIYGSQTNKGVGGLLSGLDTDDLVKQMTAATRNKINRQYQAKQKLLYKQEAYREISQKLLSFSDKYFSYSSGSKTNILSRSFFEANTFKSSSNYVNVTGDAENIKNFSIKNIETVASAASMTSSYKASNQSFSSKDIPGYFSPLAGEKMSIEYNGETYELTISNIFGSDKQVELEDVANELNNQIEKIDALNGDVGGTADNELIFTASNGKLSISKETAIVAAVSNDIKNILHMEVGKTATSTIEVDNTSLYKTPKDIILNSSINFEYNGVIKTVKFSEMREKDADGNYVDLYTYDANGLSVFLNKELKDAYGDNITVGFTGEQLTFKTNNNNDTFGISSISKDLSELTGIAAGNTNRINRTKPIGEAGLKGLTASDAGYKIEINNKIFEFESTASLNDIINTINNDADAKVNIYYSSTTDTFSVRADETGAHIGVDIKDINGNLVEALFGSIDQRTINAGKDTKLTYTLNGVDEITVTRSTSNFSIDGINIELNKNAAGQATPTEPITFDVTNNSDEVVERVKQFINDYNEIITLIGSQTKEKPNRNYLPLTPEQQDEMEEKEIENWNKEAKKGVLFGDSNMNSVMNNLRSSMTGLTSVSSLTLANIGIASAGMDTSGKLILDEKKFKEKLLKNPDEIANLFTQSTTEENGKSGIAIEIQKTLRENIGAFGTSGILIEEAGLESGLKSDQNNISLKMKEYDDKMKELKKDLEKERERYWSKFSALESALNNLNAQSSWLTDMMG